MKAEVKNGHLQVYPENDQDRDDLMAFYRSKLNRKVGALFQRVKDGVVLPEKTLIMIQITKKGVKV